MDMVYSSTFLTYILPFVVREINISTSSGNHHGYFNSVAKRSANFKGLSSTMLKEEIWF